MAFKYNSPENKQRKGSRWFILLCLLGGLAYGAYERLDQKVAEKIVTINQPLKSSYVKKIPASYGTGGKMVIVYGTQECFRGPVTKVRRVLESQGYVFNMYDLNANIQTHRSFQNLLALTGSDNFVLPAYVVHDRMIFNNGNIVEQIQAVVEEQPQQTAVPQGVR